MYRLLLVILVSVVAIHLHAESARGGPMFMGLGDLPGGQFASLPDAVSADGSTVVGHSAVGVGALEAFRWTASGGIVGLGDFAGGAPVSQANGVSADGSVIVGQVTPPWVQRRSAGR